MRESATAATVVEALRVAVMEALNANNYSHGNEAMRDSYLRKVDELASQLSNVFDSTSVAKELLRTQRYWFIANNPVSNNPVVPDWPPMSRTQLATQSAKTAKRLSPDWKWHTRRSNGSLGGEISHREPSRSSIPTS